MTLTMSLSLLPWILNSLNSIVSFIYSVTRSLSDIFPLIVHKDDISREQLKELLYEEIMSFNPPTIT